MWLTNEAYRKIGLLVICILNVGFVLALEEESGADEVSIARNTFEKRNSCWRRNYNCQCSNLSHFVDTLTDDVIGLHKNLFSVTSLKVLVGTAPFYMGVRPTDKVVHNVFYCGNRHRNLHQPPRALYHFFDISVPVAMVGLSLFSFSSNEDLATTARVFAVSLPFIWVEKNILKKMFRIDAWSRPYNQHFPKKRVFGGCPSGHMVFSLFATTLFGSQFGPRWGVPMALFSAAIFADFVAANRHYASQMILGAGLGIVYGLAASKVVDCVRNMPIQCSVGATPQGKPALDFSFSY